MLKNNNLPNCCIIVLNFNAKAYLENCLKSLQKLNYPKDKYRVVFVDNASSDGSVDFVRRMFPKLKMIVNRENYGFMKGNNIALRSIKSEYYVLLNPDTFVEKNWLINLVNAARKDNRIALCSSKVLTMDDKSKINYAGGLVNFLGIGWPRGFNLKDNKNYNKMEEIGFASGASMLIKDYVLKDIGFLDEDFFIYYEDVDYSWRARMFGYDVFYVPSSVVYHKHEGSVRKELGMKRKFYYLERNRLETLLKNYSSRTLWLMSPLLVVFETMFTFYFLIFYKSPLKLSGFLYLIKNKKRILEKRVFLQKNRIVSDKDILKYFTYKMPDYFTSNYLTKIINLVLKMYYKLLSL